MQLTDKEGNPIGTVDMLFGFKLVLNSGQIIRNCQEYATPEECMKAIEEVTNEINTQG
jgi:uncharacterized protein YegP (UPF0339 family)